MKTLDKISKTLDIMNKALTAIGWIAGIGFYGWMAWWMFIESRK